MGVSAHGAAGTLVCIYICMYVHVYACISVCIYCFAYVFLHRKYITLPMLHTGDIFT